MNILKRIIIVLFTLLIGIIFVFEFWLGVFSYILTGEYFYFTLKCDNFLQKLKI